MTSLVVADHDNHALASATGKAVTAALQIDGEVDVLVAGADARAVAEAAARLAGVRRVLLAEAPWLAEKLAEPMADLVHAISADYAALIAPATAMGKDVMPRVAALVDAMQISDIVAVEAPDVFRRPIYAGNALQTVRSCDATKVVTVRVSAFAAPAETGAAAIAPITPPDDPGLSRFVANSLSTSERPELTSARIVVSGGRALGSVEKFSEIVLPLADALGAAVGASRAAVDAGYAPNDWQVGQTGKIVAPELYIAVGISGAIQHLAGMKDSKVIVAINKDADAPIFQIADYGIVGDIFDILPELQKSLAANHGKTS